VTDTAPSLFTHRQFALRRLHSLLGIVPVGLFLINHLLANSTAFLGQGHFNHHIELIHSLPWLVWIETLFIFVPLAFHGILGVVIALEGRPNHMKYPYLDNWRYTLQRVTAYITIVFVTVHLLHYRFAHWFGINASYASGHEMAGGFYAFTVEAFQAGLMGVPVWAWTAIYVIGLVAAVYHFCNGIVTFCITWGIIIGDDSRKRMSLAALGLGVLLAVWGLLSLHALGTAKIDPAADEPAETHAALVHEAPPGSA
jgi:succinate dehydrogenase / fumarate reductase cytochrome b subunit